MNGHHDASTTRRHTIETINPDILIGMTATAYRSDKKALSAIYQDITSYTSVIELIEQGYLVNPVGMRIDIDADIDSVKTIAGDLSSKELSEVMNTDELNNLVVQTWIDRCENRKTIAFCVDKKHTIGLCSAFMKRGIKAEYILDNTTSEQRQIIYEDFRNGNVQVMVNCTVLSERL